MESKPFWQSKTFWVNVVAMGASVAGVFNIDIDPELQTALVGGVMGVLNIILRVISKDAVHVLPQKK